MDNYDDTTSSHQPQTNISNKETFFCDVLEILKLSITFLEMQIYNYVDTKHS